jgi:hypothetical protein
MGGKKEVSIYAIDTCGDNYSPRIVWMDMAVHFLSIRGGSSCKINDAI